jgi:hypothetical protein
MGKLPPRKIAYLFGYPGSGRLPGVPFPYRSAAGASMKKEIGPKSKPQTRAQIDYIFRPILFTPKENPASLGWRVYP